MWTWCNLNTHKSKLIKAQIPVLSRTKHVAGGNLQTSMSGSCAVCVDGVLYLFGGHHARGNTNRVQLSWCLPMCRCCLWDIFFQFVRFQPVRLRYCLQYCFGDGVLQCALQIYRLPLRASSFVWEEMKDLKGLSPSCKDKLGCWVYKNRWGTNSLFGPWILLDTSKNVRCQLFTFHC